MHTESKWVKGPSGNMVIGSKELYVSYNDFTSKDIHPLMLELFQIEEGAKETVLVKDGVAYVLNGDFRFQYEKLIELGWGECIKFFDSKPEFHSDWSTKTI